MYKIIFWYNENKSGNKYEVDGFSSVQNAIEASKILVRHFLGYTYAEVYNEQNEICFSTKNK